MTDQEDPKKKIKRLIRESSTPIRRRGTAKKDPKIKVRGDGNITAGRDINLNPVIRPKVVVKTGDGTIDAAQKAELHRLVGEWIESRQAVRRSPFGWPAAWKAFNNAFGINKYDELPMEEFGKARAWLQRQIAIIDSMPSARKKAPNWRARTISAIKARCKNQLRDPDAYRPYIKSRFGKDSLAHLADDELQRTKTYIMGRPAG